MLPIPTGIRMTIQSKQQRTARARELALPLGRPLVPRELDPSFRTLQLHWGVRGSGVGLPTGIANKRSKAIACLGGTHGGRVAPKFLKHCHFPILITNLIAKKNNTPLKLARGVVRRKLRVLFKAQLMNTAEMDFTI